jgi:putative transposase
MTEIRKRRKVYNEPYHAHFVTFSCSHRWPLLNKDRSRQWVIDALENLRDKHGVETWAYVVMPEHFHAVWWSPQPEYDASDWLAAFKRPISAKAKRHLLEIGRDDWIKKLTVTHGDRTVFQFWQPGGGFDENLWNEHPLEAVIDYIHANPVRRGLVQRPIDWFWSSARWYAGLDDGPFVPDRPRL